MRSRAATIAAAIAIGATLAALQTATADPSVRGTAALREAAPHARTSQARSERPPPRVRIHRDSRPLGPDARRHCEAWYEQELRPSGTVIVPRMSCYWQRG